MEKQTGNGILEEIRMEFWDCWQRIPNKGFFLSLMVVWIALFHFIGNSTLGYTRTPSLFLWMYDALTSGGQGLMEAEEGYGVLIPLVVLGLFWSKRRELVSVACKLWWPGLLLVGLGLLLHVLGYLVQQPRFSVVGMFTGLYGLMGLSWGWTWLRTSFFPFFLFGFCMPLGSLAQPITFRLQLLVCRLVELVSHYILAIDVIREGNLLKDPTNRYQYEVAAACSGMRSLIATIALAVILAFISLRTPWKRAVMIAAAFPLAVLGNLLRMLLIVIAAELGGQDWGNYVHDGGPGGIFSLLPYALAFIGLLMLEGYLREPESRPSVQTTQIPETNPT
ncbi:MAG TPA: exosortase/archaeosortase family protein [Clostridia bacterium]|nr:exosortase/archaeosortase family protein [Clostridia bacterium]